MHLRPLGYEPSEILLLHPAIFWWNCRLLPSSPIYYSISFLQSFLFISKATNRNLFYKYNFLNFDTKYVHRNFLVFLIFYRFYKKLYKLSFCPTLKNFYNFLYHVEDNRCNMNFFFLLRMYILY